MAILDYAKAKNPSWVVGAYIGGMQANADLNLDEYHKLTLHADYILIHSFNDSPTKAFNYAKTRLTQFARCTNKTPIIPLLSTEWRDDSTGAHVICDAGPSNPEYYNRMCFLGKWLETHQLPEAEAIYLNDYNNWSLKTSVNLQDAFAYFAYTHTKLNSGWVRLPTTLTIQSRSTTSDSALIVRSSPITCTIQSLSSTPTNTPWGVRRNLTLERTSESVTNLTNIKSRKEISLSLESTTSTSSPEIPVTVRISTNIESTSSTSNGTIQVPPEKFINLWLNSTTEVATADNALLVSRPIELVIDSLSVTSTANVFSNGIIMLQMPLSSESTTSQCPLSKTALIEFSATSESTVSTPEMVLAGFPIPVELTLSSTSSTSPPSINHRAVLFLDIRSSLETQSPAIATTKLISLILDSATTTVGSFPTGPIDLVVTLESLSTTSTATIPCKANVSLDLTSTLETSDSTIALEKKIELAIESETTTVGSWDGVTKPVEMTLLSESSTSSAAILTRKHISLSATSLSETPAVEFLRTFQLDLNQESTLETSTPTPVILRSIATSIVSGSTSEASSLEAIDYLTLTITSESVTDNVTALLSVRPIETMIESQSETSSGSLTVERNLSLDTLSELVTSSPHLRVTRPHAVDFDSETVTSDVTISNKKKITMTILSLTDTSIATIDRLMNCRLDLQSAANDASVPLGLQIYTEAVINSVSTTSGILATHALGGMVPRVRVL